MGWLSLCCRMQITLGIHRLTRSLCVYHNTILKDSACSWKESRTDPVWHSKYNKMINAIHSGRDVTQISTSTAFTTTKRTRLCMHSLEINIPRLVMQSDFVNDYYCADTFFGRGKTYHQHMSSGDIIWTSFEPDNCHVFHRRDHLSKPLWSQSVKYWLPVFEFVIVMAFLNKAHIVDKNEAV